MHATLTGRVDEYGMVSKAKGSIEPMRSPRNSHGQVTCTNPPSGTYVCCYLNFSATPSSPLYSEIRPPHMYTLAAGLSIQSRTDDDTNLQGHQLLNAPANIRHIRHVVTCLTELDTSRSHTSAATLFKLSRRS